MRRVTGVGAFSIVLLTACARPIATARQAQLVTADALLLQGCYDCLVDARQIYRQLAAGSSSALAATRVFEADLLIALREKELAVPLPDALTEAHRLARDLPHELEPGRYIELIEAIPGNELGLSQREVRAAQATPVLAPASRASARAWLSRGKLRKPVREYLQIALDCSYPTGDSVPSATDAGNGGPRRPTTGTARSDMIPLLRYRAAICEPDAASELAAVRASEPRFVEASLFIARAEIARLVFDGPRQAKAHLDEVLARFPGSPAIAYLAGSYHQLVGDHAEALRQYDRTLALHPEHDPALLGRIISLSDLERGEDAIEAATKLIARGADHLADAYYWRARNRHALGQIADARRDVSAAKELVGNEDILLLAGMIEYEQSDLDVAQADLAIVINANGRRCEAHWYLGLVERQCKRWPSARQALEDAMTCYHQRARTTADQLRSMQARSDLDPTYRARAAASLDAAVVADTRQEHLAALAASGSAGAGGDFAAARRLADIAAEDPALAERAARLRNWLDRSHRVSP